MVTFVASVQGQSLAYKVRANIPFDFTVGEKKLSAGEYSIGRTQPSVDIAISITDVDGHTKAIRLTNAAVTTHPKKKAYLVFHRYGDQYFLSQVWPAGGSIGREFPVSASERAQREAAKNSGVARNVQCETVTIAADLR